METNRKVQEILMLFSCQVVSDFSRSHGLQHTRLPCPSPSPVVCPSLCPLNQWCHSTVSFSVALFSSCLQSFQHQGLFQWFSCLHQVPRVLELQLQPPVNVQSWFPLGVTGLISLLFNGLSRVCSSTTARKHQFFGIQPLYSPEMYWYIQEIYWYLKTSELLWALSILQYNFWKRVSELLCWIIHSSNICWVLRSRIQVRCFILKYHTHTHLFWEQRRVQKTHEYLHTLPLMVMY